MTAVRVTQTKVEAFFNPNPKVRVTQVKIETFIAEQPPPTGRSQAVVIA